MEHNQNVFLYLAVGLLVTSLVVASIVTMPKGNSLTDVGNDQVVMPISLPISSTCSYNIVQVLSGNPRTIQERACSDNHVIFQSTNASLVFQNTFNNINANGGGRVHITGYSPNGTITTGAYNFSGSVALPDSGYMSIFGDGSKSVIKVTGDNVYAFYITGTKTVDNFLNEWPDIS